MRYQEFNLTEDELFELNMSPGNLKKMAQGIDARAGMEFELIVPGVEEEEEEFDPEPDYEVDEGFPVGRGWQRDVISFFRGGDMGNSTSTIQRAIDSLNEDFWSWMDEAEEDFISSPAGQERVREIATDNVDPSDYDEDSERELQQAIQDYIDQNEEYIRDEISQEFRDDADTLFERWLDEQEIRSMSDFGNQYNLDWPYWTEPEYYGGGGTVSIDANCKWCPTTTNQHKKVCTNTSKPLQKQCPTFPSFCTTCLDDLWLTCSTIQCSDSLRSLALWASKKRQATLNALSG